MIVVTVEASCTDLEAALAVVEQRAADVRRMPGCRRYEILRNDAGKALALLQHWDSESAFEGYRESATFRELGAQLQPLLSAPPVTVVAKAPSESA